MPNTTTKRYDRAKLVKLVKESKPGPFEPTIGEVVFWYDTLNEILFESKLPKLTGVIFCKTKYWAEAYCHRYKHGGKMRSEIRLSYHFKSFKDFLEILAHEMVHIWEFDNFSCMTHGDKFFSWAPELKKLGLDMAVSQ